MRYIVFSDLHSNLEALNQFEKEISSISYDRLVCLGDIVGYANDQQNKEGHQNSGNAFRPLFYYKYSAIS